jgi:hypothetical protein
VKKTCHNRKREKPTILIVPTKVAEPVAEVIAQLVKPTIVPLRYPCIIYFSFEHCALDCPRKIEVQNMFRTKPTITITIITKNPRHDNVLINVVVDVTTCSQVPKQHAFRERELVKAKVAPNW